MGAFFTNVQVRADAKAPVDTHKALVDAIGARAIDEGFTPCADASQPDRTIIVGPADAWIGVYDQGTESQRLEPLDELARFLSRVTKGPAVGVLVHDSDHLLLRLFENGALTDALERGTGKKKGKVEAWAKVFPASAADLRGALDRRDLFVEETLRDVARALGMGTERACTGYRYLQEEGPIPEGSVVLRLRLIERPANERPVVGPPRLVASAFHPRADLSVGGPLHVAASVRNEGGASRGLMVAVHGDAIEALLVEPERAQIVVGVPGKGVVVERPFEHRKALRNGKPGYVVDLPELDIPAGSAGDGQPPTHLDAQGWVERMLASQVHVNVLGAARSAGSGRLFVSFVPLEAREAQFHHALELVVEGAPRKPLRGAAPDPSAYVALETPDVLIAH
ncbi:MAG TPA: hypothetical protein VHS09_04065, partial [Polyangiaceae bacterium]|nr:hypothetical protein [Polyangiaceae bacterium]